MDNKLNKREFAIDLCKALGEDPHKVQSIIIELGEANSPNPVAIIKRIITSEEGKRIIDVIKKSPFEFETKDRETSLIEIFENKELKRIESAND